MQAFHNKFELKSALERRAETISSTFQQGLRGLGKNQHAWQVREGLMPLIPETQRSADFGQAFGLPAQLAFLQKGLFGSMKDHDAVGWPKRFVRATPVGADLSDVFHRMSLYVLADPQVGLIQYAQTAEQGAAIDAIADLFLQGCEDEGAWKAAERAALDSARTAQRHGHGINAAECRECIGYSAAYAAAKFAAAVVEPSYAEEAVGLAAWPLRHLAEYEFFAAGEKHRPRADARGMVNVADALFCAALNRRDHAKAAHRGEEKRWALYNQYANKLVVILESSTSRRLWLEGRFLRLRDRLLGVSASPRSEKQTAI